jgi:hypothetical protein
MLQKIVASYTSFLRMQESGSVTSRTMVYLIYLKEQMTSEARHDGESVKKLYTHRFGN